jgi:hypothetical protein
MKGNIAIPLANEPVLEKASAETAVRILRKVKINDNIHLQIGFSTAKQFLTFIKLVRQPNPDIKIQPLNL